MTRSKSVKIFLQYLQLSKSDKSQNTYLQSSESSLDIILAKVLPYARFNMEGAILIIT